MTAADETAVFAYPRPALASLFLRFVRHGCLAFGGPAVQIGMLRHELVDRERWTTPERFLRALAVYQVLPGPEATELCCWFGHLARGRLGALAAGLGFVLPGFVLMLFCSWLYVEFGMRAVMVAAAFSGMQPAVLALVVRAVPRIGARALRARGALLAAAAGAIGEWVQLPFALPLLFGALWLAAAGRGLGLRGVVLAAASAATWWWWPGSTVAVEIAVAKTAVAADFVSLLVSGLGAGLLTFGGAYTAIPFVRNDAVIQNGWLTEAQFLDGLAIGGVIPAPLVIFGTFTGYVAAGLPGALAMTIGIFAPAFSFTLVGHELIERLMAVRRLHAAFDGVAAAVAGIIAAVALRMCSVQLVSPFAIGVFVVALLLNWGWQSRFAVPAIVAFGGLAGWLLNG